MTQNRTAYNVDTGQVNPPLDSPDGEDGRGQHGYYGGPSAYATQEERANSMGNFNGRDVAPLPGQTPLTEKGD
jgi:hypothetical protein